MNGRVWSAAKISWRTRLNWQIGSGPPVISTIDLAATIVPTMTLAAITRTTIEYANPATLIDPDGHRACVDEGDSCETDPKLDAYVAERQISAARTYGRGGSEWVPPGAEPIDEGWHWSAYPGPGGKYIQLPNGQPCIENLDALGSPMCADDPPAPTNGICLSGSAMAGLMLGVAICIVEGHLQISGQAGASTGVGVSIGVDSIASDVESPSGLGGVGGGFGGSFVPGVGGGFDQCFSKVDGVTYGCRITSFNVGIQVSPEVCVAAPVVCIAEGHAYGSFTIDVNDFLSLDWLK